MIQLALFRTVSERSDERQASSERIVKRIITVGQKKASLLDHCYFRVTFAL